MLPDHAYVFTARQPWICAAPIRKASVYVNAGPGYVQEFWTHEPETVCGRKVTYPHTERSTSPGWPRRHQLCPDCVRLLAPLFPPPEPSCPSCGGVGLFEVGEGRDGQSQYVECPVCDYREVL